MKARRIFISSVQKELAEERQGLRDYIHLDPLLRRFFEVFLFENLPAADRPANRIYLDEVSRCDIYLGIFANEYVFWQESATFLSHFGNQMCSLPRNGSSEADPFIPNL